MMKKVYPHIPATLYAVVTGLEFGETGRANVEDVFTTKKAANEMCQQMKRDGFKHVIVVPYGKG